METENPYFIPTFPAAGRTHPKPMHWVRPICQLVNVVAVVTATTYTGADWLRVLIISQHVSAPPTGPLILFSLLSTLVLCECLFFILRSPWLEQSLATASITLSAGLLVLPVVDPPRPADSLKSMYAFALTWLFTATTRRCAIRGKTDSEIE